MYLDLSKEQEGIEKVMPLMFDALMALGPNVRPSDETPRTGVQSCIKFPHSRDIIMPKAYTPSPIALHFASEKIVRAYEHGYWSSRVNADPKKFEFAGGLVVKLGDYLLLIGSSGLTEDEDEMFSFTKATRLLKEHPSEVFRRIYPTERDIPNSVFNPNGYIWQTLSPFCYGYSRPYNILITL